MPVISQKKSNGFTIVELLIVIVVIGILAAITVVAYNGVRDRASNTSVQSDLSSFAKKLALFHADYARYPTNTAELATLQFRLNSRAYDNTRVLNFSYCASADRSTYAIGGISNSGKQYFVSSANGVREYASSLTNDGNKADLALPCDDLLAGTSRVQAGFYISDTTTGPWRTWTGGAN
jgi:prepilin-type N-terminal cleavage/methylation domain-containing protein